VLTTEEARAIDEIYDVHRPDAAISFLPVLPNATFKGWCLG